MCLCICVPRNVWVLFEVLLALTPSLNPESGRGSGRKFRCTRASKCWMHPCLLFDGVNIRNVNLIPEIRNIEKARGSLLSWNKMSMQLHWAFAILFFFQVDLSSFQKVSLSGSSLSYIELLIRIWTEPSSAR